MIFCGINWEQHSTEFYRCINIYVHIYVYIYLPSKWSISGFNFLQSGISTDFQNRVVVGTGGGRFSSSGCNEGMKTTTSGAMKIVGFGDSGYGLQGWKHCGGGTEILEVDRRWIIGIAEDEVRVYGIWVDGGGLSYLHRFACSELEMM